MARYFYSDRSGNPTGPVDVTELKRLLKVGVLNLQSNVAKEGVNEWVSIRSVLGHPSTSATASTAGLDASSRISTDDLLRRLIDVQERQLHWVRLTGIAVWITFVLAMFGALITRGR